MKPLTFIFLVIFLVAAGKANPLISMHLVWDVGSVSNKVDDKDFILDVSKYCYEKDLALHVAPFAITSKKTI